MKAPVHLSVLGTGLLLVAAGCAHTMPAGTTTTTLPSSSGQPVVMSSPAQPGSAIWILALAATICIGLTYAYFSRVIG